jgi:N-acetylglucosamine-6-phosphate deacetylase
MDVTAYLGADIFDGAVRRRGAALLVAGGRIEDIVAESRVSNAARLVRLDGGLIAPGFIDIQVNGGGGVLLNGTPTAGAVAAICAAHARFGTTGLLPTVITDRPAVTAAAIAAVREAMRAGVPGCLGIHVEGPFLSVARKGAHDPALIRGMTDADFAMLAGAGVQKLLLTVAPETVSPDEIRRLVAMGVIVSVGHSDAGYDTVAAAYAAGARGTTHLFNAMSGLGNREPGVVGAALDTPEVWCGIIPDGHHVHPAAIGVAVRAKRGPGRMMAISDAMPTAADGGDEFWLNGRRAARRDGRLTLDDGTLAGSDITMDAAVRYLVAHVGVDLEEALRMASLYPAAFLGLAGRGSLQPGTHADFVHLDDRLTVAGTWIGGGRVS